MTTPTDAYDLIDRFLRNNLGDDDYAEYSAALEMVRQPQAVAGGEPVGVVGSMPGTSGFNMVCFNSEKVPVGTKLYTAPPPQAVRKPLSTVDLMRVVMDADVETRGFATRGTTNWAAHIGKAVQNAVLGIAKGGQHGTDT